MAGWTHNTNVNTLGFTPLQLVTGKNVMFPGVSSGNIVTESLYDDEGVKKIMERHGYINKKYREQEFSRKSKTALNARLKGYEDGFIEEDDLVYYQAQNGKAWLGPVKVFAIKGNSIWIFAHGDTRKIPRCNVKICRKKEDVIDDDKVSEKDEKVGMKFEERKKGEVTPGGKPQVKSLEEQEESVEGNKRMRTQSMDKDLQLDNVSTFWMKVENNECFDDIAIYNVEILTKDQNTPEVKEAKQKELQNLFKYDVFEEVDDVGS